LWFLQVCQKVKLYPLYPPIKTLPITAVDMSALKELFQQEELHLFSCRVLHTKEPHSTNDLATFQRISLLRLAAGNPPAKFF
jgi:hypothetical protein